eukprot:XP_011425645.1 PREDICTED: uncharacterized protein DDB_G0285917-like [Crassostrea gigas]
MPATSSGGHEGGSQNNPNKWGDECSCGSSEHDSGDDSPVEEVNKENGAQLDEAQERESEPEMEVNETPENPTEDDIGKTHDEQKKVEPEIDSHVKENSGKISEPENFDPRLTW